MNISIELTAILGAAIIFTIWLARVGFSVEQVKVDFVAYKVEKTLELTDLKTQHQKEIDGMRKENNSLARDLREEFTKINTLLQRIAGKLDL